MGKYMAAALDTLNWTRANEFYEIAQDVMEQCPGRFSIDMDRVAADLESGPASSRLGDRVRIMTCNPIAELPISKDVFVIIPETYWHHISNEKRYAVVETVLKRIDTLHRVGKVAKSHG